MSEGEQSEALPALGRISQLEKLKSNFCIESSEDESIHEKESPYKPFNIMQNFRTQRLSRVSDNLSKSPRTPHHQKKQKYNDERRRKQSSSAKLRDVQQNRSSFKSPYRNEIVETEESVTERDQKLIDQIFVIKSENAALKRTIETLEDKLVEISEQKDKIQDDRRQKEFEKLKREFVGLSEKLVLAEDKNLELGKHNYCL